MLHRDLLSEDDEVLFAIAQELAGLVKFLRGSYALLIAPLEQLALMEETVVREEAVKSLVKLAEMMPDSDIVSTFAPMVVRLSEQEKFSGKMAASFLISTAYPRAGSLKEKLRTRFFELSHEETPMIRRAIALNLSSLCSVVEKDTLLSQLMVEFKHLSVDEQDNIRNVCIDVLVNISKLLSREENRLHTLPLAIAAGEDKSWKVRIHFAEKFPDLAESFGRDVTENSLIQTLAQLLKDPEADVRAVCLHSLQVTLKTISTEKVQTLVCPQLSTIAQDTNANANVRMHISDIVAEMALSMGAEVTMGNLISILEDILKDENPEVKMHVAQSMEKLATVLGAEFTATRLCTAILALSKDCANWRVREAVISQCAKMGIVLGADVFVRSLQGTYFLFLRDISHAVRKAGQSYLPTLAQSMRGDWVRNQLLPAMRDVLGTAGYVQRITVLHCLPQVDLTSAEVVGFLSEAVRSQVPNVRFNACKVAGTLLAKQPSQDIRK